jgi:hypothetical protein
MSDSSIGPEHNHALNVYAAESSHCGQLMQRWRAGKNQANFHIKNKPILVSESAV